LDACASIELDAEVAPPEEPAAALEDNERVDVKGVSWPFVPVVAPTTTTC